MKIDSTTSNGTLPLQDGAARTQQSDAAGTTNTSASGTSGAPAQASSSSAGEDANVSLSGLSSSLRSLAASGSADIDTAQVESIKSAIRNGTLQIDTGKIADGVLQTARDLLTPASGN
ncbi:flagellar biosynthesis anti-sigma factor FlgM [Paraburkholderia acidipaludis]|uniref:flagellar biosynthesis anti-sigma factor FlgM n=1 Tax=Paraburkholderia acidipaludis TaxID=660537 RepID=UPI0004886AFC|nr:flagellar biosynthesis anti-sigma factor FlgM [Paraburkholderia acidipaludis]